MSKVLRRPAGVKGEHSSRSAVAATKSQATQEQRAAAGGGRSDVWEIRRIVLEWGRISRGRAVPQQPSRGACLQLRGMNREREQIGKGVDAIEPAGEDDARTQVAGRTHKVNPSDSYSTVTLQLGEDIELIGAV